MIKNVESLDTVHTPDCWTKQNKKLEIIIKKILKNKKSIKI